MYLFIFIFRITPTVSLINEQQHRIKSANSSQD